MKVTTIILLLLTTTGVVAQKVPSKKQPKNEIIIPAKAESWDAKEKKAKFTDHKGIPSIEVNGDLLVAKEPDFTNGTIEFDIDNPKGFVGIYFRWKDNTESEFFYLREVATPSASVDAIQYTPIIKSVNMWDMYYDYQTGADFKKDGWTHIKLVVSGMQMLVYVNDLSKAALQIPRLEGNTKNGAIAFQGNCFISNVVVKPYEVEGLNPNEGFDPAYNDIRYIRNWQLSEPASLPVGQELTNSALPDILTKWQPVAAERRGLINVTRVYGLSKERRCVWLRAKIISTKSRKVKVSFGFSDEVWVFANDRTVFVDKNLYGQGMRKTPDGRISIQNAEFDIQLKEGENELVVGLANDFYGWGIMARLEDLDGITLNADFKQEVIDKDLEKYFGLYSDKDLPTKLRVSQKNGKLSILPTGQSPILFDKTGDNKFYSEETKITVEFVVAENRMLIKTLSQSFVLTKE